MVAGHTTTVALANLVAAVVNIALNVALVPRFGLQGSAAATVGAYVLLYLLLDLGARRVAPIPRPRTGTLVLLGLVLSAAAAQTAVPSTTAILILRGTAAAGTLAWFAVRLLRLNRRGHRG